MTGRSLLTKIGLFVCLGAAFGIGQQVIQVAAPQIASASTNQSGGIPNIPLTTETVPSVVRQVAGSVVEVDVITNGSSSSQSYGPYFGGPSGPSEDLGSGFVLTSTGYIATNEHVVDQAQRITVLIPGIAKPLPAKLIGADWQADLAVIKVNPPHPLRPLVINTRAVAVGEPVVAIGNPYGLDNTVTDGVISAVGRPLTIGNRPYSNLLQTSAAINPGNSGGPLLDMLGRVVGINTAVSSQGSGIGFAIPAVKAAPLLNELMTRHAVTHAFIGVGAIDLTPFTAFQDGLSSTNGSQIMEVYSGSPAAGAGLQQGDVITGLNGHAISATADLVAALETFKPGQTIHLTVLTPNGQQTYSIRLSSEPSALSNQSTDLYGATPL